MSSTLVQLVLTGLLQGLLYSLIGLGLYLVFSVMRVVNFAHGYLVLIGMYGVLVLDPQNLLDYAVALVIVAVLAAGVGYAVERFLIEPGLDKGGHSQLVITLSLGIVFQYTFQVLFPDPFQTIANPWPWDAVTSGGVTISVPRIAAGVISLVLGLAVSWLVYRTRAGKIMRACSESLSGALHVGVHVPRTYRTTFVLGAALAAVAGGLLLPIQPVSPLLGLELTVKAFIVVVIGGSGALWGTVVAGVLLGLAEAVGSLYAPGSLATSLVYALFFLVILLRPQGIVSSVRTA
ncbi:branched-chain amino acid ABC transporter permease [Pseudonocardia humida]|uniref:Branched-chain amino acid ABC transporter permease n=1 Tax=Pseudonocardia humida TaxID=2800819 RepID=A0ABT1A2Q0_9PSEU|nr:branched-chain amino acid ABC transporter permease [Pseudonocardia humida]MCO1657079.1 branched-chain amino acid ABC transporter permease [Pseudonocardia humida]